MLEFTLLAVDTLLQSYGQSLCVVLLAGFGFYICKNGITLQRTVLQEKEVTTKERNVS